MNRTTIIAAAFVSLIVGALVAPVAQALSTPLSGLKNCDNITVGASAVVSSKTCMGETGSSILVQNESTSCIRVGGPGVTATTGVSIGDGCAGGKTFGFDGRVLHMISVSGDVAGVDVVWGLQ